MRYALVPIHELMKPWESIISECQAGVYVGDRVCGLISRVRFIRYESNENKINIPRRDAGRGLEENPRIPEL